MCWCERRRPYSEESFSEAHAMDSKTRFLLGKMVGLLRSDHDGEVVAAARQIRRLLESKRLTFGDLVALVGGPESVKGRAATVKNGTWEMAERILENELMMRPHEIRFVKDVAARSQAWAHFRMTPKQSGWFSYLYARYG
jgi:hypothetical protein